MVYPGILHMIHYKVHPLILLIIPDDLVETEEVFLVQVSFPGTMLHQKLH